MTVRRDQPPDPWVAGRAERARLREHFAATLPQPCARCGRPVTPADRWVIGHIESRVAHPELTWDLSNMRVEHRRCSDATGSGEAIAHNLANPWRPDDGHRPGDHPDRLVVVLFGPPGAGKTTAARANPAGLEVYDPDDPDWTPAAFARALSAIGRDPGARAVVVRVGSTRNARITTLKRVRATHAWLLTVTPVVSRARIAARHRGDGNRAASAVADWWRHHLADPAGSASDIPSWPGTWPTLTSTSTTTTPTSTTTSTTNSVPTFDQRSNDRSIFPHQGSLPTPRPLENLSPGSPPGLPEPPLFDPVILRDAAWLTVLAECPDDAAWPRHMSPPHPEAVGTYGPEALDLVERFLHRPARWWQRLVLCRLLEHDAAGELVWRNVVLSAPRRAGKSVILAALALWRMTYGPDRFPDTPTDYVIAHVANTLAAAMEVQRKTWTYAGELGWKVSTANGKEHIEGNGYRWLCQAAKSGGYATGVALGIVDEAWNVAPGAIDEGLEPATMERVSPQLVVVSTAHRRATSTMRRRLASGLAGLGEDWDTLVALWGAGPEAAPGDERTWRAASPHWSADRRRLIAGKFERAMRGEADPDADDPDAMEGFRAQYLNVWPAAVAAHATTFEAAVVDEAGWAGLAGYRPRDPAVAAIESWFGQGVCVATAEPLPHGRVGVSVREAPDLAAAARWTAELGVPVLAGKSLTLDPVLADAEPMSAVARHVVEDLRRLIDDGLLRHDDSPILAEQVLGLRTTPTPNGPRVTSRARLDAVKAALWAAQRARVTPELPAVY